MLAPSWARLSGCHCALLAFRGIQKTVAYTVVAETEFLRSLLSSEPLHGMARLRAE